MKNCFYFLLLLLGTMIAHGQTTNEQGLILVGQPSIFWRNGEWQTYKEGRWIRYVPPQSAVSEQTASAQNRVYPQAAPEEMAPLGEQEQPAPYYDSTFGPSPWVYAVPGGYGYGFGSAGPRRHRIPHGNSQQPTHRNSQSAQAVDRSRIGIGQNTTGIGQPTIGIGQPNMPTPHSVPASPHSSTTAHHWGQSGR
jgi:hypothetical protein